MSKNEDFTAKALNKTLYNNSKIASESFCRNLPLKNSKRPDSIEKHKIQKKECLKVVRENHKKFMSEVNEQKNNKRRN